MAWNHKNQNPTDRISPIYVGFMPIPIIQSNDSEKPFCKSKRENNASDKSGACLHFIYMLEITARFHVSMLLYCLKRWRTPWVVMVQQLYVMWL